MESLEAVTWPTLGQVEVERLLASAGSRELSVEQLCLWYLPEYVWGVRPCVWVLICMRGTSIVTNSSGTTFSLLTEGEWSHHGVRPRSYINRGFMS